MTIEQTVEIPASHRLRLDLPLPFSIPTGKAKLELIITAEENRPAESAEYINLPPSYSPDAAINEAKARRANPNREPISRYFGILSQDTFGDGVAYQRSLRDEWDD